MSQGSSAGAQGWRPILPFAALSATYFAHVGFFNPYLPLWLKEMGMPIFVISMLASAQSFTRVFAPYAWGALSDHLGERTRLLRFSALVALVAAQGLWWNGGAWWFGLVLLVLFTNTSSMMSLTEAAVAHLVAGDWGRYGRVRLWGSAGFLLTVLVAGAWFERFGIAQFPLWTTVTLACVLYCTWRLPDHREKPARELDAPVRIGPTLRKPVLRWFFASIFFHITAHFAIYGFMSLYFDSLGYGKGAIGAFWAVSVIVEIAWFFLQGKLQRLARVSTWLVLCGVAMALRMLMMAGLGDWAVAIVLAQMLHALTFAGHHTACIATVSHHFAGRLRGRGQALFTTIGYGVSGVVGVLAGGWMVTAVGFRWMYAAAALLSLLGTACAWKVHQSRDMPARD